MSWLRFPRSAGTRLLRRLGRVWGDLAGETTVAYTTTIDLQVDLEATTAIEPVYAALQRADSRSYELFAGVLSSARCSAFCSVL